MKTKWLVVHDDRIGIFFVPYFLSFFFLLWNPSKVSKTFCETFRYLEDFPFCLVTQLYCIPSLCKNWAEFIWHKYLWTMMYTARGWDISKIISDCILFRFPVKLFHTAKTRFFLQIFISSNLSCNHIMPITFHTVRYKNKRQIYLYIQHHPS